MYFYMYIDEEIFFKLFDGCNFPYQVDLAIDFIYINRLTKEFINQLPSLRKLNISCCNNRTWFIFKFATAQFVNFVRKNETKFIEEKTFSNLKNLQKIDLSKNRLTIYDRNFIGFGESVEAKIENNEFDSWLKIFF